MKRKLLIMLAAIWLGVFSSAVFAQEKEVMNVSTQVVKALQAKDGKTLAALTHPTKGVRFSPYGYINTDKSDLVFKKSRIAGLFASKKIYDWGAFDAGEEEIKMNYANYHKKFVYDVNFAAVKNVKYNEVINHGTTIVNVAEAYPNGKFVEYYYPGTKKYEQMDWRSLRLIFEKSGRKWYLVGISHDQWST